jgi:hypothetical protein
MSTAGSIPADTDTRGLLHLCQYLNGVLSEIEQQRVVEGYFERFAKKLNNLEQQVVTLV